MHELSSGPPTRLNWQVIGDSRLTIGSGYESVSIMASTQPLLQTH